MSFSSPIPAVAVSFEPLTHVRAAETKPSKNPSVIRIGNTATSVSDKQKRLYEAIINNNGPLAAINDPNDPMIRAITSVLKDSAKSGIDIQKNGHTLLTFFLSKCVELINLADRAANVNRVARILQAFQDHGANFLIGTTVDQSNCLPPVHYLYDVFEQLNLWHEKDADSRRDIIRFFKTPLSRRGGRNESEFDSALRIQYTHKGNTTDILGQLSQRPDQRKSGMLAQDLIDLGCCESPQERLDREAKEEVANRQSAINQIDQIKIDASNINLGDLETPIRDAKAHIARCTENIRKSTQFGTFATDKNTEIKQILTTSREVVSQIKDTVNTANDIKRQIDGDRAVPSNTAQVDRLIESLSQIARESQIEAESANTELNSPRFKAFADRVTALSQDVDSLGAVVTTIRQSLSDLEPWIKQGQNGSLSARELQNVVNNSNNILLVVQEKLRNASHTATIIKQEADQVNAALHTHQISVKDKYTSVKSNQQSAVDIQTSIQTQLTEVQNEFNETSARLTLIQANDGRPYISHLILAGYEPVENGRYYVRFETLIQATAREFQNLANNDATSIQPEDTPNTIKNPRLRAGNRSVINQISKDIRDNLKILFLDLLNFDRELDRGHDIEHLWNAQTPITEMIRTLNQMAERQGVEDTLPGLLKLPIVASQIRACITSIIPSSRQTCANDRNFTRLMYLFLTIIEMSTDTHSYEIYQQCRGFGLDSELELMGRGVKLKLIRNLNPSERKNLVKLQERAPDVMTLLKSSSKLAMGRFMICSYRDIPALTEQKLSEWIICLENIKRCFGNAQIQRPDRSEPELKSDCFFDQLLTITRPWNVLLDGEIGKKLQAIVQTCHPVPDLPDERYFDVFNTISYPANGLGNYSRHLDQELSRLEFKYNLQPTVFLNRVREAFLNFSPRQTPDKFAESPVMKTLGVVFRDYVQDFLNISDYEQRYTLANAILLAYEENQSRLPVQYFINFMNELLVPSLENFQWAKYNIDTRNALGSDRFSGQNLFMSSVSLKLWDVSLYCMINGSDQYHIDVDQVLESFFEAFTAALTSVEAPPMGIEPRQLFLQYAFVAFETPDFFIIPFLNRLIVSNLKNEGINELLALLPEDADRTDYNAIYTKLSGLVGKDGDPQDAKVVRRQELLFELSNIIGEQINTTTPDWVGDRNISKEYLLFFQNDALFRYINGEGAESNLRLIQNLFPEFIGRFDDLISIPILGKLLQKKSFYNVSRYQFIRNQLFKDKFLPRLSIADKVSISELFLETMGNEGDTEQSNFYNQIDRFFDVFSDNAVGMAFIRNIVDNPALGRSELTTISTELIGRMSDTYRGIQSLQDTVQSDYFSKFESIFEYRIGSRSIETSWIPTLKQLDAQVKFQIKIQVAQRLLDDFIIEKKQKFNIPKMSMDFEIILREEYEKIVEKVRTYVGQPQYDDKTKELISGRFANAIAGTGFNKNRRIDIISSLFEGVYLGTDKSMIPFPNQLITLLYIITRSETDPSCKVIGEVGTGEGKSLIIAMLSAYLAIKHQGRIDIIVSNDILGRRDAQHFKGFFEVMGIDTVFSSEIPIEANGPCIVYTTAVSLQKHVANRKNAPVNSVHDIPSVPQLIGKYLVVDEGDVLLIGSKNNDLKTTNDTQTLSPILEEFVDEIWARSNQSPGSDDDESTPVTTPSQASDLDVYHKGSELEKRFMDDKFSYYYAGAQQAIALTDTEFEKKYWITDDAIKTRTVADDIFRVSQDLRCTEIFLSRKYGLKRAYPLLSNFDTTKLSVLSAFPGIVGFTGTLGNDVEIDSLRSTQFELFKTPRLVSTPTTTFKMFDSEAGWLKDITALALSTATRGQEINSPVLILVNTVADLSALYTAIYDALMSSQNNEHFSGNVRILDGNLDLDSFNKIVDTIGQNNPYGYGHITIATKVGHRGIDPKIIGKDLAKVGLTVIDTRLDLCRRDSIQKEGRAARNGLPGTVHRRYCIQHIDADMRDSKAFGDFGRINWTGNTADNERSCIQIQDHYIRKTLVRDDSLDQSNEALSALRDRLIDELSRRGITNLSLHNRTLLIWWSSIKDLVRAVAFNEVANDEESRQVLGAVAQQLTELLEIQDPSRVRFSIRAVPTPIEWGESKTDMTFDAISPRDSDSGVDGDIPIELFSILADDLAKHIRDPRNLADANATSISVRPINVFAHRVEYSEY